MAVSDILKYFKENEGKFPRETLIENLRKGGYPEGEIEEALKILRSSPPAEAGRSEETRASTAPVVPGSQMVPGVWKKIGAFLLGFCSVGVLSLALSLTYGLVGLILSFFGISILRLYGNYYGYNPYSYGYYIGVFAIFGAIFLAAVFAVYYFTRRRYRYFALGVLCAGVLAVIITGAISAVVYLSYERARVSSRDSRRVTDIKQLQLALELYWDSSQAYPQSLDEVQPKFIPQIPRDPVTGEQYFYEKRDSGYYMRAELENASNYALQNDINPGNMSYEVSFGSPSKSQGSFTNPPATINPFSDILAPGQSAQLGAATSTIKILSPNGGEIWQTGEIYPIYFQSPYIKESVRVYLISGTGSGPLKLVSDSVTGGDGKPKVVHWTVPQQTQSGQYKIYVEFNNKTLGHDYSDLPFTLAVGQAANAQYLTLKSPNGGEALCLGKTHNIQWQHSGMKRVTIRLSDGQATYTIGSFPADFNETGKAGEGLAVWKAGEVQGPFGDITTLKEGYAYILTISGESEVENPFSTKSDSSDKTFAIIKCEG